MKIRAAFFGFFVGSACVAGYGHDARALDIDGVWVSDAAVCKKVFQKDRNRVSFIRGSGRYGNGFIIVGNQIRGRIARCNITTRREEDSVVNIIAVCSTDIAIDTIQFRLKVDGPDTVVREFPGIPELQMRYERCSL